MRAIRRKVRSNPMTLAGAGLVVGMLLFAFIGPILTRVDPIALDPMASLEGPSVAHWFGTDRHGRDVLARTMYGGRVSLGVAGAAVVLSLTAGGVLGLIGGYSTRWPGRLIMRTMDVLMSFPSVLFAIGIVAMLGPGAINTMIAIAIVYTPRFARVAHSSALTMSKLGFVEAAHAIGASNLRILFSHIGRNSTPPLIVQATFALATATIAEASLGFLGLGVQPPQPSWGSIIRESLIFLESAPWMVLAPSLAIMLTILGFNLLGDTLRDALDPRLRGSEI